MAITITLSTFSDNISYSILYRDIVADLELSFAAFLSNHFVARGEKGNPLFADAFR